MADATTIPAIESISGTPTTGTTPTSTSGGFDISSLLSGIGSLGALGTSLYDLFGTGGNSLSGLTQNAAQAADPFASQRPQYMQQLQGLMTNPSSFQLSPAAQAQMTLGSENLARQQAAQGYLGSGNILGALQKYGQQVASGDYYNQLNELNLLSGAQTGSPAAAGVALSSLYGNRQQALTNLGGSLGSSGLSSSLGSLGGLISQLFGGSSSGSIDASSLGNLSQYFSGAGTSGVDYGSTLGTSGSLVDQFGTGDLSSAGSSFSDLSSSGLTDPSTYSDFSSF